ncbi:hypothetical protein Bbelb_223770 [Branchiostoma belcheri]|nr:hypothetical protein Bbelb_223770 [Branchiostoma belcheri]
MRKQPKTTKPPVLLRRLPVIHAPLSVITRSGSGQEPGSCGDTERLAFIGIVFVRHYYSLPCRDSNPGPVGSESSTLPLRHTTLQSVADHEWPGLSSVQKD